MVKNKSMMDSLDDPIPTELEFWRKGKAKITIIFEDMSSKDYFKSLGDEYFFTIAERKYFIDPKCFIKGKYSTILYYFNNPFPIKLEYERSKLTSVDLESEETLDKMKSEDKVMLGKIHIDAQGLHSAFSNKLLRGLYDENKPTITNFIIIAIVVVVVIAIILQMTGVININELMRNLG